MIFGIFLCDLNSECYWSVSIRFFTLLSNMPRANFRLNTANYSANYHHVIRISFLLLNQQPKLTLNH